MRLRFVSDSIPGTFEHFFDREENVWYNVCDPVIFQQLSAIGLSHPMQFGRCQ